MGKIRIISGIHRSIMLDVIDSDGLRPTSNRIRETLFNWLGQDLTGKKCLDAFAGSGALGFEAISLGAMSVTMIEKDSSICSLLKKNKEILKAYNLEIINADSTSYLKNCKDKFDVIFLDPPYASELLSTTLNIIKNNLSQNGMVFIEYKTQPELVAYEIIKSKKYGMVNFALLRVI